MSGEVSVGAEILKSQGLVRMLYAWGLPSALFVGAIWLFLLPQLGDSLSLSNGLAEDKKGLVFLALTGVLALSLSLLSTMLYRLLEGFIGPRCLQEWGIKRHTAKKKALADAANKGTGWRGGFALGELSRYPKDDLQIVPTEFGNAIRAFETYGKTRFNLDSQTLWHELFAVAPQYIQSEINSARSSVECFVALVFLSGIFSFVCWSIIACWVIGFIANLNSSIPVLGFISLLVTFLFYRLAIRATDAWKYPIHALVNLGRVKLADSLGLRFPETLEEEKKMWLLVTRYAFWADTGLGKELDSYRKPPTERRAEKCANGEGENGGNSIDGETP